MRIFGRWRRVWGEELDAEDTRVGSVILGRGP